MVYLHLSGSSNVCVYLIDLLNSNNCNGEILFNENGYAGDYNFDFFHHFH